MPIEARPGQSPGVHIPIESVGVRLSARQPGERRLNLVRPATPEQPRTLLQEMQQYITTRQSLRDNGYFFLMGKEPEKINLADATSNDLRASWYEDSLPDNSRDIMGKGNIGRIQGVFHSYAMRQFSLEKQRDVLASEEGIHEVDRQSISRIGFIKLTSAETETVQWLLARIGVPFDAPPEGFRESYSSLLFRMRNATAEHQHKWEQEQKPAGKVYHIRRRLKG